MTAPVADGAGEAVPGWASAAYRQKSLITGSGVGPAAATWVSRTATAPVAGTMCAAVPVPPTRP